ncbi:MAG: hypothetical protein ACRDT2_05760 [Natronosporangium sp.]
MSRGRPPQLVDELRVVLARYEAGERVDVIDIRSGSGLAALLSLDAHGAVQLAHYLFRVASWVEPQRPSPVPDEAP